VTDTAVLFDMDGTLIDTPAGILRVLNEVLTEAGMSVPDNQVRATIGRPLVASFASLLTLPDNHPDVAHAVTRFRQMFTDVVIPNATKLVFPGVLELLAGLRAQGRALAVVTSKIRRSAEELLSAAGLLDSFDVIVCHDMAERGKPHPDLALLAATELRKSTGQCVVVGDAVDDVRMAVAAGIAAYGVSYGVASRKELEEGGALIVLDSVGELTDALKNEPLFVSNIQPFLVKKNTGAAHKG
jgi:phosphoglycolate phosphatase